MRSSRILRSALLIGALPLLAGCAMHSGWRDAPTHAGSDTIGAETARQSDTVERRESGDSDRSSTATATARDQAVTRWTKRAEDALHANDLSEAEEHYRRVLEFNQYSIDARAGLSRIARLQRHAAVLVQAEQAWRAGDAASAQMHLRSLLAEHPAHPEASALQREVEQATSRQRDTPTALAAQLDEIVTLAFKEAPIKQVFEVLSRTSGVNFLFDREVRGEQPVTVFLRDTTVAEAVELILLTNQLEQRAVGDNAILVFPNTPAKQREYQPLTVRAFVLVHADAKSVANVLKSILKLKDVVNDDNLNMIVMRDTADAIRLAERLIALHDVPEPEVMLEVTVLEIKRSRFQELGIRWPDQLTLTPLARGGTTVTLDDLLNITPRRTGAALSPLMINANRHDGDANILANPRIRARNRESAKILIGERVPNITTTSTATGFVSESVQYVDVGLKLDVQPTVYPNDEIAIKISLEVSNIISQITTPSGSVVFQIGTRTASTLLRLRDGENEVLAGLISDEVRNNANALPGLRSLPLIGRLFANERDESQKAEVVLSITPRLVRNVRPPALDASEFESGTEASLRSPLPGATVRPQRTAGRYDSANSDRGKDRRPEPEDKSFEGSAGIVSAAGVEHAARTGNPATFDALLSAPVPSGRSAAHQPSVVDTASGTPSERAAGGADTGPFSWHGPHTVRVGETFTVSVVMNPPQPVSSVPLQIAFDPAVLEPVSAIAGDLFARNGAGDFTYRIDRSLGQMLMTASRSSSGAVSGPGTIAEIAFRAISAVDPTHIEMRSVSAAQAGGGAIRVAPPAPHTLSVLP